MMRMIILGLIHSRHWLPRNKYKTLNNCVGVMWHCLECGLNIVLCHETKYNFAFKNNCHEIIMKDMFKQLL